MATRELAATSSPAEAIAVASANQNYSRPLAIVTTLFFMWGFLTCLNDILVPHLKSIFDLSYTRVMLVQFAFFFGLLLIFHPVVEGREQDWLPENDGRGVIDHGGWSISVRSCRIGCFIPAVSHGSRCPGYGNYGPSGVGKSLRGSAGQTGNSIEPARFDASVQFVGYHYRTKTRRASDPRRGADGDGRAAPTVAACAAHVSRAGSSLGEDAIHGDLRCAGVAGHCDQHLQIAKDRTRYASPGS